MDSYQDPDLMLSFRKNLSINFRHNIIQVVEREKKGIPAMAKIPFFYLNLILV